MVIGVFLRFEGLLLVACQDLIAGLLVWLLCGHPCRHQCVFRSETNIPRGFQGASDIGVFRAGVESNQPHAIWALHLIAALEP
jgi:hypothetical protein